MYALQFVVGVEVYIHVIRYGDVGVEHYTIMAPEVYDAQTVLRGLMITRLDGTTHLISPRPLGATKESSDEHHVPVASSNFTF